jgi:hypothetical protein
MRTIIINKKQLKKIYESVDMSVKAPDNTSSSFVQTLTNPDTVNDLNKTKQTTDDVNTVVRGPKTTDNSPTIDINVTAGDTVQSVIADNPEISSAINNGASAMVHGDGYPQESKVYTKASIEEMRVKDMANNGIVLKKGLFEEISKTKKNHKTWTPKMISEIYSHIEDYPKNSDEFKVVRAAVYEMQRNRGIKNPTTSNDDFPSVMLYEDCCFVNGILFED